MSKVQGGNRAVDCLFHNTYNSPPPFDKSDQSDFALTKTPLGEHQAYVSNKNGSITALPAGVPTSLRGPFGRSYQVDSIRSCQNAKRGGIGFFLSSTLNKILKCVKFPFSFLYQASQREILRRDGLFLVRANQDTKANLELVRIAVEQNRAAIRFASPEVVRVLLAEDGLLLEHLGDANLELARIAVRQNKEAIRFANDLAIRGLLAENGLLLEYLDGTHLGRVRIAIEQNREAIRFAAPEVIRMLLAQDGLLLEHLNGGDLDLARIAIGRNRQAIRFAAPDVIRVLLAENGLLLEHLNGGDLDLARIAVRQNKQAIRFASPEVIRELLAEDGLLLEHLNNADLDLVRIAARQNKEAIRFAEKAIVEEILTQSHDLELSRIAVQKNREAIGWVDQEIAKQLLANDGLLLEHLELVTREDVDFVGIAIRQNPRAIAFAGDDLKLDLEKMHSLCQINPWILEYVGGIFGLQNLAAAHFHLMGKDGLKLTRLFLERKDHPIMVLEAISQNPEALQYASDRLKSDKNFILMVVKINGLALKHADEDLRADIEVVTAACEQNIAAFQYVDWLLREDLDISIEAVKRNGLIYPYLHEDYKQHPKVILEAFRQNPEVLQYLGEACAITEQQRPLLDSVREEGLSIENLGKEIQDHPIFALEAVSQNTGALQYLSKERQEYFVSWFPEAIEWVSPEFQREFAEKYREAAVHLQGADSLREEEV